MLVLARKVGQTIVIAENIKITVTGIRGDQVRLGVEAPREIPVYRKELLDQIQPESTGKPEDSNSSLFDDGE